VVQSGFRVYISPQLVLLFFCLTAFFAKIGSSGQASYDNLYYAEKAREMLVTGDYWTVHYNYVPNFVTAPMYYWLAAGSYHVFGVSDYAAALPSAILGTLTILLMFFWLRREFDEQTAWLCCLIMATIPQFLKFSRHAMLDVSLTFYCLVSLISYFEAAIHGRRKFYLLWGLAAAFGILTKSVLGTFPLIIGGSHLLLTRRWRELKSFSFWGGVFVALSVGLSWYVYHYIVHYQEFYRDHIQILLRERSLLPEADADWFYRFKYLLLPFQYIPHWCLLMVAGFVLCVRRVRSHDKRKDFYLLLLLWYAVVVGILSASAKTKTWYMMSAFPALAIMGGLGARALIQKYVKNQDLFFKRSVMVFAAIALAFNVLVTTTPLPLGKQREVDQREFSPYIKLLGDSGYKMIGYKADTFSMNNATLFYGEYAFLPVHRDRTEFMREFATGAPVAAMVSKPYWRELTGEGFIVVKEGDNYVLITNKAMDFSKIQHLKSRWLK